MNQISLNKDEAAVTVAASPSSIAAADESHGRLYWLWQNMVSRPKSLARKHRLLFPLSMLLALFILFLARGYAYEYVITCRKYFGAVLVGVPSALIGYKLFRRSNLRGRAIILAISALLALLIFAYGRPVHNYCSLYWRYETLNIVRLSDLPETAHERIQPLNSVFTMASGQIAGNDSPTEPHFVRIGAGGNYRFTMGAEPIYFWPRVFGGITEIYDIPGTNPDVDLSGDARVKVSFEVGDNLKWGRNAYVAVSRAFGLWRYLNYEPDGVIYMKDDAGKWVQVVPLIRWKGILFPWPEFGGVQVIEQAPNTFLNSIKRTLVGCGYYVSPREIEAGKYPFLKGQNIMPYRVSRYIAESFKFHKGKLAPLPGFHKDDIRIADMPEDVNDQPFVIHQKMSAVAEGADDSLYHYFSLEPFNINQQGSVIVVYAPADGKDIVYAAFNEECGLNLIGISSVPQLVKNDHPFFDWSSHVPVENRPYVRVIDGKRHYFALTTIVTKSERNDKFFIGGNNPNIALTDLKTRRVYWMRPPESSTWVGQLREQMKLPAGDPRLPALPGASGPPSAPASIAPSVTAAPATPSPAPNAETK